MTIDTPTSPVEKLRDLAFTARRSHDGMVYVSASSLEKIIANLEATLSQPGMAGWKAFVDAPRDGSTLIDTAGRAFHWGSIRGKEGFKWKHRGDDEWPWAETVGYFFALPTFPASPGMAGWKMVPVEIPLWEDASLELKSAFMDALLNAVPHDTIERKFNAIRDAICKYTSKSTLAACATLWRTELLDLLNPLHGSLDKQINDERLREEHTPPDREWEVSITEKMERDLTKAVLILEGKVPASPMAVERNEVVEEAAKAHGDA